jgi:hypothetical protein
MLRKILQAVGAWLERRRNLRRYNQDRRVYEAAIGANLRFVEKYLKKRES